jgi:hypothetical protein
MGRKPKNAVNLAKNDGRANNGAGKPNTQVVKSRLQSMTPAKMTQAKKAQISSYALKAMKKVFGSEDEAWMHLAEQAKDSFAHMNLLWQYRYGKPGEAEKENNAPKITAPVINFYASTDQIKELDNTIDITPEEDVDYNEYEEEDEQI